LMSITFDEEMARSYDEKNKRLAPIADCMHFLIRLALKALPNDARILCVGAGTGAEILSLAREYPGWSFVGVDPSAPMLAVCRQRLEDGGIGDRCELMQGYVQDLQTEERFDAVLSVLVGHFIKRPERLGYYEHIHGRLKRGGYFVNTEISVDLDSETFPALLKNWEQVQALMGGTAESIAALPQVLCDTLTILPPSEVEHLLRSSGFGLPVCFFQAFMIAGWYAIRE